MSAIWSRILDGITPSQFFRTCWGRKHWHRSGDPNRFERLLNWTKYEQMLNSCSDAFSQENVRVVMDQRILPASKVFKSTITRNGPVRQVSLRAVTGFVGKGATFVLRGAHSFDRGIAELATSVEMATKCRVSTNLYHTPCGSQGFPSHFDTHDIFVLQLEGAKNWKLHGFTRRYPTKRDASESFPIGDRPATNLTLERGDILYLPRGLWHSAVASKDQNASLHLSVGVHAPTGVDILQIFEEQANDVAMLRQDVLEFHEGRLRLSENKVNRAVASLRRSVHSKLTMKLMAQRLSFERERFGTPNGSQ